MDDITANVGSYRMSVGNDPVASANFLGNGLNYESHIVNRMRRYLSPGSILLDVGACWGYYMLVAAHLTGNKASIVSVEPNPWNVEFICRNIRENKIENAVVLSVGAGDRIHWLNYQGSLANANGQTKDAPGDPVLIVPLDLLLPELVPTAIKLDIEGSEPDAVIGMHGLISRTSCFITEFYPDALKGCGHSASKYQQILQSLSFSTCELLNTGHRFAVADACGWEPVLQMPICDLCFER